MEEKQFLSWMRETGKIFTGEEYKLRYGIWLSNKRYIHSFNNANLDFTLAINHLAHLTPSEYKSLLGLKSSPHYYVSDKIEIPSATSCDWRTKNKVNPIQDQGQCGSCWAFSAIQAQESQWAIVYNRLQKLSEQSIVDCVSTCNGCDGGDMDKAYDYIISKQSGQFNLETEYPYLRYQGTCNFGKRSKVQKIIKYIEVQTGNEDDLAAKVENYGPAAIGIDASHYSFQMYLSGIYDEKSCSPTNLDHGVGCVGFGAEGSTKYWIVRNSWGRNWGEKGYIRMIRDKSNQCGVATRAIIPVVK